MNSIMMSDTQSERRTAVDYTYDLSVEEMDYEIERFIEAYDGTAIGEHIARWRENASSREEIESIYEEVMDN